LFLSGFWFYKKVNHLFNLSLYMYKAKSTTWGTRCPPHCVGNGILQRGIQKLTLAGKFAKERSKLVLQSLHEC